MDTLERILGLNEDVGLILGGRLWLWDIKNGKSISILMDRRVQVMFYQLASKF
jgi:hypothetical protein